MPIDKTLRRTPYFFSRKSTISFLFGEIAIKYKAPLQLNIYFYFELTHLLYAPVLLTLCTHSTVTAFTRCFLLPSP